MEISEKEASEKLRVKTDRSLEDERGKTDDYLTRKSEAVTEEAEEAIRLNRLVADEKRDSTRAETDLEIGKGQITSPGVISSSVEDRNLLLERERSDKARNLEREKDDRVRSKERFQKRLIAEALLENERKETDHNLLDERARIDLNAEQNLTLLSDEKISHDLTKTALVSRDQFLAVVSHDLKNPLSSISMSASLLRDHLSEAKGDFSGSMQCLEVIERNAANMDRMISDLLDVERIGSGKLTLELTNRDVRELLLECQSLFAPVAASKKSSLNVAVLDESLIAVVDHDRILQVLSNLIGNALKFKSSGGTIELFAKKVDEVIEITISDDGPGIPDDRKSKIFDRFSQLGTNDRRGLGLGLFISKWIVEAHKGRIWVTSQVGKGSVFHFTLPLPNLH